MKLIVGNRNYSSWSLRPWVLMAALGIAFRDRVEPFTKPANYGDFRRFSPTGQVPERAGAACRIELDLGLGDGEAAYLASDPSYDYVKINAEYRT